MDIFDKLQKEVKALKEGQKDIFDRLSLDIFDRIKAELPAILKKYTKPDKPAPSVEITPELVNMVRAEIKANIQNLPVQKVIEKVIEKQIVSEKPKQVTIKETVDPEKLKSAVDEQVKKKLDDFEKSRPVERFVVGPLPLPNMENQNGKYLTTDGHNPLWGTVDLSPYLTIASAAATYLPITTAASTYVPYTGATGNVDLNYYGIYMYGHTGNSNFYLGYDDVGAGLYMYNSGSPAISVELLNFIGDDFAGKLSYTSGTTVRSVTLANASYAIDATGIVKGSGFYNTGESSFTLTSYPGHKKAYIGSIDGNTFDGTGFSFSNWDSGTDVLGMVYNADSMFLGSPITGSSWMILDSGAGTYAGGAIGYLQVASIEAITKGLIGTSDDFGNAGCALTVYSLTDFPNTIDDPVPIQLVGSAQIPLAFYSTDVNDYVGYVKGDYAGNLAFGAKDSIIFETGGFGSVYQRGSINSSGNWTISGKVGIGTIYDGALLNIEGSLSGEDGSGYIRALRFLPTQTTQASTSFNAVLIQPTISGNYTQSKTVGIALSNITLADSAVVTTESGIEIATASSATVTNYMGLKFGAGADASGKYALYDTTSLPWSITNDNKKIYFGIGSEWSIYNDAANLVLFRESGTGKVKIYCDATTLQTLKLHTNSVTADHTCGIGFAVNNSATDTGNIKSAIVHQRKGSYGQGDLVFLVDPNADGADVAIGDEIFRLRSTGSYLTRSGSDIGMVIQNTVTTGTGTGAVSIVAETTSDPTYKNMGKIVFGRVNDYTAGDQDSFMDFYTSAGNTNTLALRIDNAQDFNFQSNNLTTTGNIYSKSDSSIHYFGAANDGGIQFDGNSLNIKSNLITATDKLELTAGTSGLDMFIGAESQIILTDGKLSPTTNSDVDLGDATHFWQNCYFERVGINSATDAAAMLIVSGGTFPAFLAERTTSGTTTTYSGFQLRTKTSGDMTDGFGGGFVMSIQDSAGVDNNIARLACARDGGDTIGRMKFDLGSNLDTYMYLTTTGLTIGYGTATDFTLNFLGTNNGTLTWMEDEDYFKFSDDVYFNAGEYIGYNITPTVPIHIKLGATELGTITIDGTTTDLTTAGNYVGISNKRDIAIAGSGTSYVNYGIDNVIVDTHPVTSNATTILPVNYGINNSLTNQANHTGTAAVIFQESNSGINNITARTASALTSSNYTGVTAGLYNQVTSNLTYNNGAGTATVTTYGIYNNITSSFTLSAGTANRTIYGNFTQITASTVGTSTAYGYYATIAGAADTNWLFYAAGTVGHNFLGGDNIKTYWGTGQDMTIWYDGTDANINTSDVAASDLQVTCGANKTIELQNVVYDDVTVSLGNISRPGVSDPAWVAYDVNGGGVSTYLLEFGKDKYGTFVVQLPHSYKTGQDIKVHVHWTPGANGAGESGNTVGWKVQYSWANIDGAFPTMATADCSDACDGTNHKHQMSPEVTIDGHTAAKGISSMLLCKIIRTDTGTDDTWVGTAAGALPMLLEVDFHIPIDTIGSRDWGTK